MPEFLCNTSPLQYLHQLGRLDLLPALTRGVIVPLAVVKELADGKAAGWDVPDIDCLAWISVRVPASAPARRQLAPQC